MAVALNVIVAVLEIFSLAKVFRARGWKTFGFYTQISNIITLVSCVAFLMAGKQAAPLRYLSTCMMTMTFLITLCVLAPLGGGFKTLMFSGNGLYHHTICPILSILSYVLWESHVSRWYLPVIVTFVYGITMLILNGKGIFDGPYPFFRVNYQSKLATVLWTVGLMALIFGISMGISAVSR